MKFISLLLARNAMSVDFLAEIAYSFLSLGLVLTFFYGLGVLFVRTNFLKWTTTSILFLRLFTGLLVFVFGYSILFTQGRTFNVSLVAVPVLFLLVGRKMSRGKEPVGVSVKELWPVAFCVTLLFCIQLWAFVNWTTSLPNIPHNDSLFYITISDYLPITGEENTFSFRSLVDKDFKGLMPYHYFELWMSAGIKNLLGIQSAQAFQLVTTTALLTITGLGLAALLSELRGSVTYYNYGLGLLLLFYSGLGLEVMRGTWSPVNGFLFVKFLPTCIFILAGLLFYIRNREVEFYVLLLVAGIVNTSALPGIVIGLGAFTVLYGLFKMRNLRWVGRGLLIIFGFGIGYLMWFQMWRSGNDMLAGNLVEISTLVGAVKTWVVQSLNLVVNHGIAFFMIGYMVVKGWSFADRKRDMLVALLCISGGGIFFSGLTHSVASSQFSYGLYSPCFVIITGMMLEELRASTWRHSFRLSCLVVALFMVCNVYATMNDGRFRKTSRIDRYGKEYVMKTSSLVRDDDVVLGIFIARDDFFDGNHLSKAEDYTYPGKYLKVMKSNVYIVNFDAERISRDSLNAISEFNRRNNVMAVLNLSDHDFSKASFLSEFRPQFLIIASDESIPEEVRPFCKDSLRDRISGERFYSLQYEQKVVKK